MRASSNVVLIGEALVFSIAGAGPGSTVYKVDLSEIVGRANRWRACGFAPTTGWGGWEFSRETHADLMTELEQHAHKLAPTVCAAWEGALSDVINADVSEPERLTDLVERVMKRHSVARVDIAERLNIRRQLLQEYCDGKTTGSLGTVLILALETLLNSRRFD